MLDIDQVADPSKNWRDVPTSGSLPTQRCRPARRVCSVSDHSFVARACSQRTSGARWSTREQRI